MRFFPILAQLSCAAVAGAVLLSVTGCAQQASTQEEPRRAPERDEQPFARDDQRPSEPIGGSTSESTSESGSPAANGPRQEAAPAPARPVVQRHSSGGIEDITFDDLALEMPAGTLFSPDLLTERVKELDGQDVRLRGFIYAGGVFQSTGIKSFPFVMNTQCKFGPDGLAYCVILVELAEGVTTDFTTYPVTVEGTLTVRPFNSGGFTWSVYHLQGRRVF